MAWISHCEICRREKDSKIIMHKIRVSICFYGRVQGVGFRYKLRYLAEKYSVTGWARNEYDGSVSTELQGLEEDIDKIRGLGLGADDYITKPFSPSEMVARVKAHMARYERLVGSGQPANEIIEIRGLKIDKTARRVWVNGEEKTFTTKEFDLLSFLAQNPNHVFTKEELFSKIWDMESIGDIATVTVHIKKIREKIEFNTAKPQYIETIWGVGIGLRYNESKRKTSAAKSGICFLWAINEGSACVAGSGARQRGET